MSHPLSVFRTQLQHVHPQAGFCSGLLLCSAACWVSAAPAVPLQGLLVCVRGGTYLFLVLELKKGFDSNMDIIQSWFCGFPWQRAVSGVVCCSSVHVCWVSATLWCPCRACWCVMGVGYIHNCTNNCNKQTVMESSHLLI